MFLGVTLRDEFEGKSLRFGVLGKTLRGEFEGWN